VITIDRSARSRSADLGDHDRPILVITMLRSARSRWAVFRTFLSEQLDWAAELVEGIDGVHWKDLLGGDWMATDGTGFKVQIRGVGLHHGLFEVYRRDELVVFQYTPEKGGESQAERLASFAGTLLVDGESCYNETSRDGRIKEANCTAHPRRKLQDAEAVQPVLAKEGGQFLSKLFELEEVAKERGLTGPDLVERR
jgi:Transposase IS66 family